MRFGGTGETGRVIQYTISQAWQISVLPGIFITIRIEQSAEMRYDEMGNLAGIVGPEGRLPNTYTPYGNNLRTLVNNLWGKYKNLILTNGVENDYY